MANAGTKAQTIFVFKEMGRNMWSSGKGFARVGALYAGTECCIEGVSPSDDLLRLSPFGGRGGLLSRGLGWNLDADAR